MPGFPPLADLLPHRPPMLLLREILAHDAGGTVCLARFLPADAALLGDAGGALPATLGLELIAQTMAVHDGLRRRADLRPRTTRGLLLGSRRFELLARELPLGTPLHVIIASGQPNDAAVASAGLVRFTGRVENPGGTVVYARGDVTVLEHRPPSEETALA